MADDSITAAIDATIDGYLAAFPANDRAAYVGAFAADGWLEDPVGAPRLVGPAGIGGFWDDTRRHGRRRSTSCRWGSGS